VHRLLIVLAGFVISGCAGSNLDQTKSGTTSIDPDMAIVIFSIDIEKSVEGQNLGLVWLDDKGEYQRGSIRHSPGDESLQRFILEVPGDFLIFDTIAIKYEQQWWIAGGSKRVELEAGNITYVGNIGIQDIQFEKSMPQASKETVRPGSIKIAFTDQSASDLAALKKKYSVFEGGPISINIPDNWGPHTYMPLSFVTRKKWDSLDPLLLDFLGAFGSSFEPF
jgi:hypothetical protein